LAFSSMVTALLGPLLAVSAWPRSTTFTLLVQSNSAQPQTEAYPFSSSLSALPPTQQQRMLETLECMPGEPECHHVCGGNESTPASARHQCSLMRDVYTMIETATCAGCSSRSMSLKQRFGSVVHRSLGVRLNRTVDVVFKAIADPHPMSPWWIHHARPRFELPESYLVFRVVAASQHAAAQLNSTITAAFPDAHHSSVLLQVDARSGATVDISQHSSFTRTSRNESRPCVDYDCQQDYRRGMSAGIFARSPYLVPIVCILGGMTIFGVLCVFSMVVCCGRFHKPSAYQEEDKKVTPASMDRYSGVTPLVAADGAAKSR